MDGHGGEDLAAACAEIRFQSPVSTDRDVDFLPLYGRGSSNESKILCANQAGHTLLYDADSGLVEVVPSLNAPKGRRPIALSINRADASDSSRADVLYVLKTVPVEASLRQCNFEALVYGDASNSVFKRPDRYAWHWVPLPPPPFVDDPDYDPIRILSHALLDGDICISTAGLGTYSFDTASCKWTKAGRWKLPFYGRAHYVPELNLLFGITDRRPHHLCAVDLASASKARAPREHDWPDLAIPEDWVLSDTTMVYLGAGRFCIAKVFDIVDLETLSSLDKVSVLTGVEMVEGGGPSKLEMIKHKSRCYSFTRSDNGIQYVL